MQMRDELGVFYDNEQFAALFSYTGQPAIAPWWLALVTVMQFAENLTDRQAAMPSELVLIGSMSSVWRCKMPALIIQS